MQLFETEEKSIPILFEMIKIESIILQSLI